MQLVFVEVKTTCPNLEEASSLAKNAVELGLCACAHLNPIKSFFTWQNSVINADEVEVMFKTTLDGVEALRKLVHKDHSYDLPAFYVVPVIDSEQKYAQWVIENSLPR